MNTVLVDARRQTALTVFIVLGWVNAFVNFLIALAFLILTPPYGGQQSVLRAIGGLMLLLSVIQAVLTAAISRRAEWARRAAWYLAFLELFQPPFGTIHAIMALVLLRRPSAVQWFL